MKQTAREVEKFTQAWRQLQNVYAKYAKKLGLTTTFIDVLDVLSQHQPCTQKEVMDALFLPKQTVSFVVKKLQENKQIRIEPDPADRRRNRISFTQQGKQYAKQVITPFIKQERAAMGHFSLAEQASLNQQLGKYIDQLEKVFWGKKR